MISYFDCRVILEQKLRKILLLLHILRRLNVAASGRTEIGIQAFGIPLRLVPTPNLWDEGLGVVDSVVETYLMVFVILQQVESVESYPRIMKKAGMDTEIEDREKTIMGRSNLLAKSVNGNIVSLESLLSEAPIPLFGNFRESFLELPDNFLTMLSCCELPWDCCAARFVGEGGKWSMNEMVKRKGNEADIRAHCEDAIFFYELDKKICGFPLSTKGLLFHTVEASFASRSHLMGLQ
ncbi:hypothetical protein PTKIN_Ptkin13bG0258600 [Pterospermum kingtungense]